MSIKRVMGPEEWGRLLRLAVLWGGSFLFVEIGLRALGPMTLVAARVGLAAAALLILVWLTGQMLGGPQAAEAGDSPVPLAAVSANDNLAPAQVWCRCAESRCGGGKSR